MRVFGGFVIVLLSSSLLGTAPPAAGDAGTGIVTQADDAPYPGSGSDGKSVDTGAGPRPGSLTLRRGPTVTRTLAPGTPSTTTMGALGAQGLPASAVVVDIRAGATSGAGVLSSAGAPVLSVGSSPVRAQVVLPVSSSDTVALTSTRQGRVSLTLVGWIREGVPDTAGAQRLLEPWSALDARVARGQRRTVSLVPRAAMPDDAGAALVSVTVSGASSAGALRIGSSATTLPGRGQIRYTANRSTTRQLWVPLSDSGALVVSPTTAARVALVVSGYARRGLPAAAGTSEVGQRVATLADSSSGRVLPRGGVVAGRTYAVPVAGRADVPSSGARAVTLTVTVSGASAPGTLQLWPEGTTAPSSTVSFTTGTSVVQVTVPANRKRLSLRSSRKGQVALDRVAHTIAQDRAITRAVPRKGTLTPTTSQVVSVSPLVDGTQVARLVSTLPRPEVGQHLVARASSTAPHGLLGRVTAVSRFGDGDWRATTVPVPLSKAYSSYEVSSRKLVVSDPQQRAARSAARIAGFTCQGADDNFVPDIDVAIDASNIRADFELDANVFYPYLWMLVTARPTVTLSATVTAAVTCERELPIVARIPVSAGPPLEIVIRPVVTVSASGEVSMTVTWRPVAVAGVLATKDDQNLTKKFSHSSDITAEGEATVEGALDLKASLTVAGLEEIAAATGDESPRVAVDLTAGPRLQLTVDSRGCMDLFVYARVAVSAEARLLVEDWTWDGKSAETTPERLWTTCKPYTGVVDNKGSYKNERSFVDGTTETFTWSVDAMWQFTDNEVRTLGPPESRYTDEYPTGTCVMIEKAPIGATAPVFVPLSAPPSFPSAAFDGTLERTGTGDCEGQAHPPQDATYFTETSTRYEGSVYENQLRNLFPDGIPHVVSVSLPATVSQMCSQLTVACNQSGDTFSDTWTGGTTGRVRLTDRPDKDFDGIPDASDATPEVFTPLG